MTEQQISKRQQQDTMKYELAKEIRRRLNEAKREYNKLGGSWDDDDMECDICEMVFNEE